MTTSPRIKVSILATDTHFSAARIEPFGPACIALHEAWSLDYNGRFEGPEDARMVIIPVPVGHEKIEVKAIDA